MATAIAEVLCTLQLQPLKATHTDSSLRATATRSFRAPTVRVSSPYAGAGPAVDRPGLRGGRVRQIGLPSWVAPLPGIPESPVVIGARLVLAGFPVDVPVPLVEPAGAGVSAVDIDLEHFAVALPGNRLGRRERYGATPLSRQFGCAVELAEQSNGPVIPDIGTQGQQCDGSRGLARRQGDHVSLDQEATEPGGEDGCPGRRSVELPVERVPAG